MLHFSLRTLLHVWGFAYVHVVLPTLARRLKLLAVRSRLLILNLWPKKNDPNKETAKIGYINFIILTYTFLEAGCSKMPDHRCLPIQRKS